MNKFDDEYNYEDDYIEEEENNSFDWFNLLKISSNWFIRIGLIVGLILLLYFVYKVEFFQAFVFIVGMILSFYFGYFFVFLLDIITSNN